MSTSTVTTSRDGATPSVTQGMHPLFRELFVAAGDDGRDRAGRKTRTRTVAVRTVRRGISRRAAQGAWA